MLSTIYHHPHKTSLSFSYYSTIQMYLEDLVAWGFVAVVAHVISIVGRGRAKAEDVAEDADDSEQALHLSFKAAGETEELVSVRGGHLC